MRSFQFLFVVSLLFSVALFVCVFFMPDIQRMAVGFIKGNILLSFFLISVYLFAFGSVGSAISIIKVWETAQKNKPKIFWVTLIVGVVQAVLVWLFLYLNVSNASVCWELGIISLIALSLGLWLTGPQMGSFWYLRIRKYCNARY